MTRRLQNTVKLFRRIRLTFALFTWQGWLWARYDEDNNCLDLPTAWRVACIVWE